MNDMNDLITGMVLGFLFGSTLATLVMLEVQASRRERRRRQILAVVEAYEAKVDEIRKACK